MPKPSRRSGFATCDGGVIPNKRDISMMKVNEIIEKEIDDLLAEGNKILNKALTLGDEMKGQDLSNVSSEEELLQLRNEGKISEDEYGELLETLRKTAKLNVGQELQDKSQPVRTSGLAIASLVFSLVGPIGCIPAVICGHLALRKIQKEVAVQGRGLALAGLIIGYIVLGPSIVLSSLLYYTGRRVAITPPQIEVTEMRRFPLDNTEGLITQAGVQVDKQISSDGNGSLRIEATKPTTVRLFETGDIDIENARLIYQARVRTENVEGQVYLEMWCHFEGVGDFFSKGLAMPLTGITGWTTEETPFLLKKGQNPDNVKLNLVINGKGTVWIDDIRLLKGPLK